MSEGTAAAAAPGWYPEADPAWLRYWDGSTWTENRKPATEAGVPAPAPMASRVGVGEIVQPPPGYGLVPGTNQVRPLVPDGGGVHFLRYVGIALVMGLSCYILVGFIWYMIALAQTGRRKRDILMLFIPIWGTIVAVQTHWRYTAKNVYWSARADRPSKSLFASS